MNKDLKNALKTGDITKVKSIIESGVDVNICDEHSKQTPLFLACSKGHLSIVNYLLDEKNAIVDCKDKQNWTPLHVTCQLGYKEIAEKLLEKGADVNATDKDNDTPLHVACFHGHMPLIELLLKNNSSVNAVNTSQQTPLHWSCKYCNVKVVDKLLEEGAHVNATDKDNNTPLHIAFQRQYSDIHEKKRSILFEPIRKEPDGFEKDCMKVLYKLLEKGADVNATDKDGRAPLHYACRVGNVDIVNKLLEKGAVVNATDKDGRAPFDDALTLDDALSKEKYEIISKLYFVDADVLGETNLFKDNDKTEYNECTICMHPFNFSSDGNKIDIQDFKQIQYKCPHCKQFFHDSCIIKTMETGNMKCPLCNASNPRWIELPFVTLIQIRKNLKSSLPQIVSTKQQVQNNHGRPHLVSDEHSQQNTRTNIQGVSTSQHVQNTRQNIQGVSTSQHVQNTRKNQLHVNPTTKKIEARGGRNRGKTHKKRNLRTKTKSFTGRSAKRRP